MLNLDRFVSDCLAVVGWPYASPGSNDERGIDCSGMLVRAYRLQRASIYHGSNRIVRVHCRDVSGVGSESDLRRGMAVFKWVDDGWEGVDYKPRGRYYMPELPGNFYHVGVVAGVNPLRIVHATTPVAKVDTEVGQWAYCGYLKDVEYMEGMGEGMVEVTDILDGASGLYQVYADVGDTVNLRNAPTDTAGDNRIAKIPIGDCVEVLRFTGGWAQVVWRGKKGYIRQEYLTRCLQDVEMDQTDGEWDDGDMVALRIPRSAAHALLVALDKSVMMG